MKDYVEHIIKRYVENYVAEKFKWLIYTQLGFFMLSILSLFLMIWEIPYASKIGITCSFIVVLILFIYRIIVNVMIQKVKDSIKDLMR